MDINVIAELLSDTGAAASQFSLASNTTLTALLQEASGLVESAAFEGGRYAAADLAGLNGNSAQALIGCVCGLAVWLLWCRRQDVEMKLPVRAEMAMQFLEKLRKGDVVFATAEAEEAGQVGEDVEAPSVRVERNGPVQQAKRLFGRRAKDWSSGYDNLTG